MKIGNKYELEKIKGTTQLPINQGVVFKMKKNFDWYFWSDQHFGAVECNYELAEKVVTEIKANSRATVTLGGDTIEAIPRGYKIHERGQHCTPDVQVARTVTALRPIAGKINCLFKGNHNTESRGESIDSDFLIAQALDIPYKTVPTILQAHTPCGTIKAAGGHGRSAAKNGDKELEQVRAIFPGCDIYFLGHNHMLYAKQQGALRYDDAGNEHWSNAWFLRTGNCLNYAEYARYAFYAPQRSGCVKVKVRNGKVEDAVVLTDKDFD